MPFNTDQRIVRDFGAIVNNVQKVASVIDKAKSSISSGEYSADELMELLSGLKSLYSALVFLKGQVKLDCDTVGNVAYDLTQLLVKITEFLSWASVNIPKSGGFLQLHSLDQEFNLVPRVFQGAVLAALGSKLSDILSEID